MGEVKLTWRVQHARHKPQPGDGVLYFAFSDFGTFEIYEAENGKDFLLIFPKRVRKPAELFHDLASAKVHAGKALQEATHDK